MKSFNEKFRFFLSLPPSLKSLIFSSFVVAFGSFMVTPFLAVFLKKHIGMGIHSVSLLVAVATFVQFGGGIVGGIVAERFGLKRSMVTALSYRTVGFFLLGFSIFIPSFTIPAVLLVAAGSALYLPANRAYTVLCVPTEEKPLFLSINNAVTNAGMGLGPLVAALLIDKDPVFLFGAVGLLFVILTCVHQLKLRPLNPLTGLKPNFGLTSIPKLIQKGGLTFFFSTYIFYVYFFFQNFLALYLDSVLNVRVFSWAILLNCFLLFFLQPLFSKRINQANYRALMTGSFSTMGLGILLLSTANTFLVLLGVVVMSLGQLCLFLRADLELLKRFSETPAIAFGLQRLAAGTGGLLSGIIGGSVFEFCKINSSLGSFWVFVALQCLIGATICFIRLQIRTGEVKAEVSLC